MTEDQLIFKIGQKVKHKLSNRIMIVVDFDVIMPVFKLGPRPSITPPAEYTGQVKCSWVDDYNFPQTAYYSQNELEAVE
ncbi:hypothetical protein LXM25_05910 [Dyadobacter sp. LJ53]|uniref:hypothetical protein n=1 Tax=Dyadobacter chenwenxiniae TaxID=2906456 RepID=UPI001F441EA2|nr:hypothetical protein [Dyadobacter chenwenxiniae]MCF0049579.1 hypothetical protein [Dyadobacter chenwenxiniae]